MAKRPGALDAGNFYELPKWSNAEFQARKAIEKQNAKNKRRCDDFRLRRLLIVVLKCTSYARNRITPGRRACVGTRSEGATTYPANHA